MDSNNMTNGINLMYTILMPMLGKKQNVEFVNCFLSEDKERIVVCTEMHHKNNLCDLEEELVKDPLLVKTYNDLDCEYRSYEFNVPERWKSDFDKIKNNDLKNVSDEYVDCCKSYHPFLAKIGIFEKLFR